MSSTGKTTSVRRPSSAAGQRLVGLQHQRHAAGVEERELLRAELDGKPHGVPVERDRTIHVGDAEHEHPDLHSVRRHRGILTFWGSTTEAEP